MTSAEMDALVRRANASGFSTIGEYAADLESDRELLMNQTQALVDVFLDAPFLGAERLLYDLHQKIRERGL